MPSVRSRVVSKNLTQRLHKSDTPKDPPSSLTSSPGETDVGEHVMSKTFFTEPWFEFFDTDVNNNLNEGFDAGNAHEDGHLHHDSKSAVFTHGGTGERESSKRVKFSKQDKEEKSLAVYDQDTFSQSALKSYTARTFVEWPSQSTACNTHTLFFPE